MNLNFLCWDSFKRFFCLLLISFVYAGIGNAKIPDLNVVQRVETVYVKPINVALSPVTQESFKGRLIGDPMPESTAKIVFSLYDQRNLKRWKAELTGSQIKILNGSIIEFEFLLDEVNVESGQYRLLVNGYNQTESRVFTGQNDLTIPVKVVEPDPVVYEETEKVTQTPSRIEALATLLGLSKEVFVGGIIIIVLLLLLMVVVSTKKRHLLLLLPLLIPMHGFAQTNGNITAEWSYPVPDWNFSLTPSVGFQNFRKMHFDLVAWDNSSTPSMQGIFGNIATISVGLYRDDPIEGKQIYWIEESEGDFPLGDMTITANGKIEITIDMENAANRASGSSVQPCPLWLGVECPVDTIEHFSGLQGMPDDEWQVWLYVDDAALPDANDYLFTMPVGQTVTIDSTVPDLTGSFSFTDTEGAVGGTGPIVYTNEDFEVEIECTDNLAGCVTDTEPFDSFLVRGNFCDDNTICLDTAPRDFQVCDNSGNCTCDNDGACVAEAEAVMNFYDPGAPDLSTFQLVLGLFSIDLVPGPGGSSALEADDTFDLAVESEDAVLFTGDLHDNPCSPDPDGDQPFFKASDMTAPPVTDFCAQKEVPCVILNANDYATAIGTMDQSDAVPTCSPECGVGYSYSALEGGCIQNVDSVITLTSGSVFHSLPTKSMETTDSNGNVLQDGDFVCPIKDLKVKGMSQTLKRGTKLKISLTGDPNEVDCRIGKSTIGLKTEFLKKV